MEHDPSESAARTLKNGLIEGRQFHDTNALLCEIYDNMRPAGKSLVLIFRGTEAGNLKVNIKDVWTDLNGGMRPTKMVHGPGGLKTKGLVHDGFWGSWEEVQSPRLGGIGTGISEASKRVPISSFATQAGKQVSSYFRQRNWVQGHQDPSKRVPISGNS